LRSNFATAKTENVMQMKMNRGARVVTRSPAAVSSPVLVTPSRILWTGPGNFIPGCRERRATERLIGSWLGTLLAACRMPGCRDRDRDRDRDNDRDRQAADMEAGRKEEEEEEEEEGEVSE